MEDRFVGDAFLVAGDGGQKQVKTPELFMLQRMDLLHQPRTLRSAKVKEEELHSGRRGAFLDFDQLQRQRVAAIERDKKFRVQLFGKDFAVEFLERTGHPSPE